LNGLTLLAAQTTVATLELGAVSSRHIKLGEKNDGFSNFFGAPYALSFGDPLIDSVTFHDDLELDFIFRSY
jgi:hypothetical protein